jgi:glutamine synthetase
LGRKIVISYGKSPIIDFCDSILMTRFLLSPEFTFEDNGNKGKFCFAPKISKNLKSCYCSLNIEIYSNSPKLKNGILSLSENARALAVILNPHVNSYKKITPRIN